MKPNASDMDPIEIIAEHIIYVREITEWHCDILSDNFIKINWDIKGDIIRSIAFYEEAIEVFLIQAEFFSISSIDKYFC